MVERSLSSRPKIKLIKLKQLETSFSKEALELFSRQMEGLSTLLNTTPAHKLDSLVSKLLPPYIAAAVPSDADPSYISLDLPHLIPVFGEFMPEKGISCLIIEGMTLHQIGQQQISSALLSSCYHRLKHSNLLVLAKQLDEGSFVENKKLAALAGVTEASLYPQKTPQRCLQKEKPKNHSDDTSAMILPDFSDL